MPPYFQESTKTNKQKQLLLTDIEESHTMYVSKM